MKKSYIKLLAALLLLTVFAACKKFLEEKPKSFLDIPSSLKSFQALLDNYTPINHYDPSLGEASTTDFIMPDAIFRAVQDYDKNTYTWANSNLEPPSGEWGNVYKIIYYANTVLEGVDKIAVNNMNMRDWKNVKGQAHFHRGKMFLISLTTWAKAYNKSYADTEPGIPLRLNTDYNEVSTRSNLTAGYKQVLDDLKAAVSLLPNVPVHVYRPGKPAAYGLLARAYLQMGDFEKAVLYADSCLSLKADLMDYNTINASLAYPIPAFNSEVIHASQFLARGPINPSRAVVDSLVYASFADNDLRKAVFFLKNANGSYRFKGNYANSNMFGGIATDEMYLTRAECRARLGKEAQALDDLNHLLVNRYKKGSFVPYTLTNTPNVLELILKERRKELLMRNLRWADIKRFNVLGANISLERTVDGKTYYLPANSPRFASPIPDEVIRLSGMPQNKYD